MRRPNFQRPFRFDSVFCFGFWLFFFLVLDPTIRRRTQWTPLSGNNDAIFFYGYLERQWKPVQQQHPVGVVFRFFLFDFVWFFLATRPGSILATNEKQKKTNKQTNKRHARARTSISTAFSMQISCFNCSLSLSFSLC